MGKKKRAYTVPERLKIAGETPCDPRTVSKFLEDPGSVQQATGAAILHAIERLSAGGVLS